ncbi:hypothetical protein bpmyx0001_53220 [Bacillus pseudomycoides DSM 12442]|nr:hypothetical protein bpmyx0001_53220 [Bacillus pseudomycoides DSM 12442]
MPINLRKQVTHKNIDGTDLIFDNYIYCYNGYDYSYKKHISWKEF